MHTEPESNLSTDELIEILQGLLQQFKPNESSRGRKTE